ncbi:MAG: histidine phosphatase family protein [Ancrocorticia sp.]
MSRFFTTKRLVAVAAVASLSFLSACSNNSGAAATSDPAETSASESAAPVDEVTIYLTRHGKTWLNTVDRVQGWSDSPLTEAGAEIATKLGTGLKESGQEFDAAYSGDMVRHFSTASNILDGMGSDLEITRMPELREISFGAFEGMLNSEAIEIILKHAGFESMEELATDGRSPVLALAEYFKDANPDPSLPAESPADVAERAKGALDKIAADEGAKGHDEVLVVTSGMTVQIILEELGYEGAVDIKNASITTLIYKDGQWTIEGVNDTSLIDG